MTTSLIDTLTQLATPDLTNRMAEELGEPVQNVSRGMQGGMAAILLGLLARSGDSSAMQQTLGFLTNTDNDERLLDDPAPLLGGGAANLPAGTLGGQFLSNIFGNRASAVNDVLSRSSGLRFGSLASVLRISAPLALAALGRRIRDGGLTASSFGQLLNDQRDSIMRAAPTGLASALGADDRGERGERGGRGERVMKDFSTPHRGVPRADRAGAYSTAPSKGRSGWVWFTGALLALGLLWAMWPRPREQQVVRDTGATVYRGGDVVPPVPMPAPTPAIILPDGSVIDAPDNGPEARLVAFLKDPNRMVDDSTWFELDRTEFETNSAKLGSGSQAQLENLAKILKAYPNATVKVGGYTDNVGSEARNKRLSQARAESVRDALVRFGISASRVDAEGYGSKHPVADNSTDDGRQRNRRIAIRVTGK